MVGANPRAAGRTGAASAAAGERSSSSTPEPTPQTLRRSSSLRMRTEGRGPRANLLRRQLTDDEGSEFSTDAIARNGTTFSARCNKYVVHCAQKLDDEHYLTPTQRSTRDLKRLRMLLDRAHQTIRQKDGEITRLKHELMAQRFLHEQQPISACEQLNISISSDSAAPPTAPGEMTATQLPSTGDSGHFECMTSPSVSSKDSSDKPCGGGVELEERLGDDWEATERWVEWEEKQLREDHERQLAEVRHQGASDYHELKEKYNDKVEALLQQLTEANGRYFELRPRHDAACLRVRQLELELESRGPGGPVTSSPVPDPLDVTDSETEPEPTPLSELRVAQLTQQLASIREDEFESGKGLYEQQVAALDAGSSCLQMDPPMRLQFLKSAVFHMLTDRDASYAGHLSAIAAVLQFNEWETAQVERVRKERLGTAT